MNDAASASSAEDRLLMLAVTGEPLPDDDPDAVVVAADVALLREEVRGLGDALASRREPVGVAVASPLPVRRRRRPLRIAVGGLVAACVASLFGGLVWLGVSAPGGSGDAADSKAAAPEDAGRSSAVAAAAMRVACSRVLVEGRVTGLTARADGDVRVVLDVARYYRPERSVRGHPTMVVTLPAVARRDLKRGTYVLIRVPVRPAGREHWDTGRAVATAREDILRGLPGARGVRCGRPGPQ